jgi:hypothetical protein
VGASVPTERPPRSGRYGRTVGFHTGTASGRPMSAWGREAKAWAFEQNSSARGGTSGLCSQHGVNDSLMYCVLDKCVSGSKDARAVRLKRFVRYVAREAFAGNGHAMARPYFIGCAIVW